MTDSVLSVFSQKLRATQRRIKLQHNIWQGNQRWSDSGFLLSDPILF